ncbi:hypothetical protein [Kingella oralis]|uniref:hypothetical protein n=1 Tax=Kingella oralis TaxID=505 RepID=UPI0034E58EA8
MGAIVREFGFSGCLCLQDCWHDGAGGRLRQPENGNGLAFCLHGFRLPQHHKAA